MIEIIKCMSHASPSEFHWTVWIVLISRDDIQNCFFQLFEKEIKKPLPLCSTNSLKWIVLNSENSEFWLPCTEFSIIPNGSIGSQYIIVVVSKKDYDGPYNRMKWLKLEPSL